MKLFSTYLKVPEDSSASVINWQDISVNDSLLYSYRDTDYSKNTYPSNMHYHDYYELVIFEEGDISYVCEDTVYSPSATDVVIIPPRKLHMSKINSEATRYKRHVFYLYPDAFDAIVKNSLTSFLDEVSTGVLLKFSKYEDKNECIGILSKLKRALISENTTDINKALGWAYLIELFCLFTKRNTSSEKETTELPESILKVKRYVDENYAQISSITDVANHFFYTREYVSRLFKSHFDTTISDYVHKRRISESQRLILGGASITDACYAVGFGSLSSFIRAFKKVTGMKPSDYHKEMLHFSKN